MRKCAYCKRDLTFDGGTDAYVHHDHENGRWLDICDRSPYPGKAHHPS